jgi:hypothetical protein
VGTRILLFLEAPLLAVSVLAAALHFLVAGLLLWLLSMLSMLQGYLCLLMQLPLPFQRALVVPLPVWDPLRHQRSMLLLESRYLLRGLRTLLLFSLSGGRALSPGMEDFPCSWPRLPSVALLHLSPLLGAQTTCL